MKAAFRIGLSLKEYNYITPHELNLHIQAYNERLRHESKEQLTQAYLTAYWGRVKRMPDLKKILGGEEPKTQTAEQMLREVRKLNALFGGTEKKVEQDD
jgi:hypothetical protein